MVIDRLKVLKYEKVRQSGVTNMFDVNAVTLLTGLDKEDILYIMKNYSELIKKYRIKRK